MNGRRPRSRPDKHTWRQQQKYLALQHLRNDAKKNKCCTLEQVRWENMKSSKNVESDEKSFEKENKKATILQKNKK